jgi:septal ring factor EnvC (AmiA/AmiB activator)
MGFMPLLLEALATPQDLQRRVTVISLLVRDQERRRQEVAERARERMEALGALSRRRAEAAEAGLELEQRRLELERTRTAVAVELRRLEGERREGAVALVEAREAEERLNRLFGRVAAGGDAFAGEVRLARGGLSWPVPSPQVVRRFGPQRDPRYGTVTVSHGVVLKVGVTTPVQAIAPGRVVYAQFFRGYGNLVIVHHGQQIYSLYSRLGTMLVGTGARVATGERVGLAGLHLEDGGNVYLEIRVGEQAQDPLLWLKPAGK